MAEVPVAPVVEEEFSVEKVLHQKRQDCGSVLLYTDPNPEFPNYGSWGSKPLFFSIKYSKTCWMFHLYNLRVLNCQGRVVFFT
jgi:hypothetical protein